MISLGEQRRRREFTDSLIHESIKNNDESLALSLRTAIERGLHSTLMESLVDAKKRKENDINRICSRHYGDFLRSVQEMLRMRAPASQIRENVKKVNSEFSKSGDDFLNSLTTLDRTLNERNSVVNIRKALLTCKHISSQMIEARELIESNDHYAAMEVLEYLESRQNKVKVAPMISYLETWLPLTISQLLNSVQVDSDAVFVTLRHRAELFGETLLRKKSLLFLQELRRQPDTSLPPKKSTQSSTSKPSGNDLSPLIGGYFPCPRISKLSSSYSLAWLEQNEAFLPFTYGLDMGEFDCILPQWVLDPPSQSGLLALDQLSSQFSPSLKSLYLHQGLNRLAEFQAHFLQMRESYLPTLFESMETLVLGQGLPSVWPILITRLSGFLMVEQTWRRLGLFGLAHGRIDRRLRHQESRKYFLKHGKKSLKHHRRSKKTRNSKGNDGKDGTGTAMMKSSSKSSSKKAQSNSNSNSNNNRGRTTSGSSQGKSSKWENGVNGDKDDDDEEDMDDDDDFDEEDEEDMLDGDEEDDDDDEEDNDDETLMWGNKDADKWNTRRKKNPQSQEEEEESNGTENHRYSRYKEYGNEDSESDNNEQSKYTRHRSVSREMDENNNDNDNDDNDNDDLYFNLDKTNLGSSHSLKNSKNRYREKKEEEENLCFPLTEMSLAWEKSLRYLATLCQRQSATLRSPEDVLQIKESLLWLVELSQESCLKDGLRSQGLYELMRSLWKLLEDRQRLHWESDVHNLLESAPFQPFHVVDEFTWKKKIQPWGLDRPEILYGKEHQSRSSSMHHSNNSSSGNAMNQDGSNYGRGGGGGGGASSPTLDMLEEAYEEGGNLRTSMSLRSSFHHSTSSPGNNNNNPMTSGSNGNNGNNNNGNNNNNGGIGGVGSSGGPSIMTSLDALEEDLSIGWSPSTHFPKNEKPSFSRAGKTDEEDSSSGRGSSDEEEEEEEEEEDNEVEKEKHQHQRRDEDEGDASDFGMDPGDLHSILDFGDKGTVVNEPLLDHRSNREEVKAQYQKKSSHSREKKKSSTLAASSTSSNDPTATFSTSSSTSVVTSSIPFHSQAYPFSEFVPDVLRLFRLLCIRFFLFAAGSPQLGSRGSSVCQSLNENFHYFVTEWKTELLRYGNDTPLSKACQISIDAGILSLCIEDLWMPLEGMFASLHWMEALDTQLPQCIMKMKQDLQGLTMESQDLIFELLGLKVDDFLSSLVFINLLPDSWGVGVKESNLQPHEVIEQLIEFLQVTFMCLTYLPSTARETAHFTTCSRVSQRIMDYLLTTSGIHFNILAIATFEQDCRRLETFADGCGVPDLRQCFAEFHDLMKALIHHDLALLIDNANLRKTAFPRLDTLKLAILLEKMVPPPVTFNSTSLPKYDKTTLKNLIKKVKLQNKA